MDEYQHTDLEFLKKKTQICWKNKHDYKKKNEDKFNIPEVNCSQ
jgi:hypothetical protein